MKRDHIIAELVGMKKDLLHRLLAASYKERLQETLDAEANIEERQSILHDLMHNDSCIEIREKTIGILAKVQELALYKEIEFLLATLQEGNQLRIGQLVASQKEIETERQTLDQGLKVKGYLQGQPQLASQFSVQKGKASISNVSNSKPNRFIPKNAPYYGRGKDENPKTLQAEHNAI